MTRRISLASGSRPAGAAPGAAVVLAIDSPACVRRGDYCAGAALERAKQALAEAGAPEDSPAFKTLYLLLLTRLLARHAVLAWEGVGDHDGSPLALTPEALDALLDRDDMLLAFWDRVVNRADPVDREGNV